MSVVNESMNIDNVSGEPMDIDNVEKKEPMDIDNNEEEEEPMDIDNDEEEEEPMDIDNDAEESRHDAISSFIQDLFNDWKRGDISTNIVRSCKDIMLKKELSSVTLTCLHLFTDLTFEQSLGKVCKELFRYKYKLEYVIVLLSFAIDLDKHLQGIIWYTPERLINVLTMELINTPFQVDDIMDIEETRNYSLFLLIIPALFMTYFLCT